jgi:hypothetical protein
LAGALARLDDNTRIKGAAHEEMMARFKKRE